MTDARATSRDEIVNVFGYPYRVVPIEDPRTGCHLWTGGVNQDGYGLLERGGKSMMAHRWYWIQFRGPIPEGMQLDHLCRNHRCVNPDHLEIVTNRENVMRGESPHVVLSRLNHCKRGHEFTSENTIQKSGGGRQCRTCQYEARRRYERRRRAKVNNASI